MEVNKTVRDIRALVRTWQKEGLTIGLVPTMGYLHEGHASLIRRAKEDNDRVVVSIFVNPTQFAPGEDLATYPRDFERDSKLCASLGVSAIFNPEPPEMYPSGFATYIEAPSLAANLCGRSRPTHFRGVCTVVSKLFLICEPDRAYFGLKDAQQFFILKRMAIDLNMDLEMIPGPTVRESDGLALSSRNAYLSPQERQAALVLHRALHLAEEKLKSGLKDGREIVRLIAETVSAEPLARLDYAEVVETEGLSPAETISGEVLVALAVFIGRTRLIDNFLFRPGV
ncbi:MAG: pantoate--beta-alanine ligase [Deltaproteobacteria bacterium]|jgi:pantoate--beta-alanine ligase|nr:pantoate--beta-alanine ligase [Deltaproteobacteria bacterium]